MKNVLNGTSKGLERVDLLCWYTCTVRLNRIWTFQAQNVSRNNKKNRILRRNLTRKKIASLTSVILTPKEETNSFIWDDILVTINHCRWGWWWSLSLCSVYSYVRYGTIQTEWLTINWAYFSDYQRRIYNSWAVHSGIVIDSTIVLKRCTESNALLF